MSKILIDRVVVEQALEAFEIHARQYPHMVKGYTLDAEEALRAALEQPQVEQEPVSWMDTETRVLYDHDTSEVDQHHGFKPTVPLYTHPQPPRQPQVEQEPVAWINYSTLTGERRLGWECESELASDPLYTKPQPQPPRQPLTEEQIKAIHATINWHEMGSAIAFARAVEAAHGIRGEA